MLTSNFSKFSFCRMIRSLRNTGTNILMYVVLLVVTCQATAWKEAKFRNDELFTFKANEYKGKLGIAINQHKLGCVITRIYPVPGQPGLQIGDIIISIGGEQFQGKTLDEIRALFGEHAKDGVELGVKRPPAPSLTLREHQNINVIDGWKFIWSVLLEAFKIARQAVGSKYTSRQYKCEELVKQDFTPRDIKLNALTVENNKLKTKLKEHVALVNKFVIDSTLKVQLEGRGNQRQYGQKGKITGYNDKLHGWNVTLDDANTGRLGKISLSVKAEKLNWAHRLCRRRLSTMERLVRSELSFCS